MDDSAAEAFMSESEEESTVVTAVPHFEEPFPPLGASQPSVPADQPVARLREREPAVEDEAPFPEDPDLHDEVFEALAGLRNAVEDKRSITGPQAPAESEADLAPAEPPLQEPEEPLQEPEEAATDGDRKIRPRRSGIFRRIFGKKE